MSFKRRMEIPLANFRSFLQKIICCQIPLRYINKVYFPHPVGIVIGSETEIGSNVTIYQNATIGHLEVSHNMSGSYSVICDNVTIFLGAVIAGRITIGSNVIIGAKAVVTQSISENSSVVGYNQVKSREDMQW